MRRRDFLWLAAGTTAFPRIGLAQQSAKLPRVAFVHPTVPIEQMSEGSAVRDVAAFLQELHRLGFVDGSSVMLDRWSGNGDPATYADVARAAVATNPDVIFVNDTEMTQAAIAATNTIPIVAVTGDLLADGAVSSLSHPTGNATGANTTIDVMGEASARMALLHAALPSATRVGCLANQSAWETLGQAIGDAGKRLGIEVVGPVVAQAPFDQESYRVIFERLAQQRIDMIHLVNAPENTTFGSLIGGAAAAARMPGISYHPAFVDGGGLLRYGPNFDAVYRGAAGQVARILKGAKPADIPVILPQRYDLTVNLKAAAALRLDVPQSVLNAATELRQ